MLFPLDTDPETVEPKDGRNQGIHKEKSFVLVSKMMRVICYNSKK